MLLAGAVLRDSLPSAQTSLALIITGSLLLLTGCIGFVYLLRRMLIAFFDNRDLIIRWLTCLAPPPSPYDYPITRHERIQLSRKNLVFIICMQVRT